MLSLSDVTVLVLPFHIILVMCVLAGIVIADREAYLWMRGRKETLMLGALLLHHRLMWCLLAGLIVTGVIMFWPIRDYLLATPAFYIKLAFVITLIANSIAIDRLIPIATRRPFRTLSQNEKRPLFINGAVSLISWLGAIIAAFNLT